MTVKIKENNRYFEFQVSGYQFDLVESLDYYDANWLELDIQYFDGDQTYQFKDHCVQSIELKSLVEDIENLIGGKENHAYSDFLEPHLYIKIEKMREYYLLSLYYEKFDSGEKEEIKIKELLNMEELKEIYKELKNYCKNFPERDVERKDSDNIMDEVLKNLFDKND